MVGHPSINFVDASKEERDTKLKRDVAIKVLASLNHSNIVAIYGVEDRALAMELAEGSSPKGPLPI